MQSLAIRDLIGRRNYTSARKPLIAFGGAVYDSQSYPQGQVESELQLAEIKKEAYQALGRGKSLRKFYDAFGLLRWGNIPGARAEVKAIKSLIPDSEIYIDELADESVLKELSMCGKLNEYKVIHFATHGFVVPEFPELSSIVLSLHRQEKNNDDGFLNVSEIGALRLNADFVNLSACETGLGKLYAGEGIEGFTQAFMIAGANSLSVSLWQVSDESTVKFMCGIYECVKNSHLSYSESISQMKRKFLNSKSLAHPFYWAPFVYYGL